QGRRLIESLKESYMKRCDAFVVPGRSSREYVMSLGADSGQTHTAPNAVDSDLFFQIAQATKKSAPERRADLGVPGRFFLFAGRLVEEKGIFDLLDAYAMLPADLRNSVGLVFVGTGPAREALEQRAASLSPGMIRCAGFAQREQLAEYYALAETFVFPTHTD